SAGVAVAVWHLQASIPEIPIVSRQARNRRIRDGQVPTSMPQPMGVPVPVVFIPKRRGRVCTRSSGSTGRGVSTLGKQKESRVEEGHLMPDHVHMMLRIPLTLAVSQWWLHQRQQRHSSCSGRYRAQAEFCRSALWGKGLLRIDGRSGRAVIRDYIRNQEKEDERLDIAIVGSLKI
uniref:transposase n=1 Tax=Xanthomonas oryzae TaxID=347 RepID=UPI003DA0AFAA